MLGQGTTRGESRAFFLWVATLKRNPRGRSLPCGSLPRDRISSE